MSALCHLQNPVLAFFVAAAGAAKEGAMSIYVQQQLEYGKLWKLVEFSQVCSTSLRQGHQTVSGRHNLHLVSS